jgi:glycosyltransferase involved in cell wall biosynthesis
VTITQKLKDYLLNKYSIRSDQILVAPDGVDLNRYCGISKKKAREQLGLPSEENVVMYTGHLYKGKGVETLVQAAKGINSLVYIVGGYDDDIQRVKREVGHPDNVIFTGFVEPSQIPLYQTAADALVAPYTKESRPWISPLKLFEYMAAGRPILASDRDVLREVLVDGETALIFEMENPESLQEKLATVLTSSCLRSNLIDNSLELVKKYTWESRARSITRWISSSHKKQ